MRFTADDLNFAYGTQEAINASNGELTFEYLCTDDHCLDAFDALSSAKKKKFLKMLERAVKEIQSPVDCSEYDSVEDYDEANSEFHARLEDYFSEFM